MSYERVLEGVQKFKREKFPAMESRFKDLAKGQAPKVLFITCSDSRIDPAMLTQASPGELFVIRNAGNIVPDYSDGGGEVATIEYALTVLPITTIIVCGHSGCGAMHGLLNFDSCNHLPAVQDWIAKSEFAADKARKTGAQDVGLLAETIEQNVRLQMKAIETNATYQKAASERSIGVHGWVYDIGTGRISAADRPEGDFRPIN